MTRNFVTIETLLALLEKYSLLSNCKTKDICLLVWELIRESLNPPWRGTFFPRFLINFCSGFISGSGCFLEYLICPKSFKNSLVVNAFLGFECNIKLDFFFYRFRFILLHCLTPQGICTPDTSLEINYLLPGALQKVLNYILLLISVRYFRKLHCPSAAMNFPLRLWIIYSVKYFSFFFSVLINVWQAFT